MSLLRTYVRIMLEAVTQVDVIERIQPEDTLLVYHGTGASYLPMVHGIDATREHSRSYGGPHHEGIFVTTDVNVADRFASYGKIIFEIEVKAKNLYGTDWSGNTADKQMDSGSRDPNEIWRDKYPESFRPYLTASLSSDGNEPQALLVGVVRPDDIKRVRWKDKWYSREELLNMQPEYNKPYEKTPTKLERMSFDPTDDSITLNEFFVLVAEMFGGKNQDEVTAYIQRLAQRGYEYLVERIEDFGWRRNVATKIAREILKSV